MHATRTLYSRRRRLLRRLAAGVALLLTTAGVAAGAEGIATLRALRDADAAYARQDYDRALSDYNRVRFLVEARPALWQARARAASLLASQRAWQAGETQFELGNWLGAVVELSRVIPQDPHAADADRLTAQAIAVRNEVLAERAGLQARDERTWRAEERARRRAAAYQTLVQTLQTERAGWPGSVGIYFRDLRDGTTIDLGGGQEYFAASVYKLAVLAYLYHQIGQGHIGLGDGIAYQAGDYEDGYYGDYGDGTALTVQELAERMVEQSDNTAARMLARTLSWSAVEDYAHALGAGHALIATDNQMTPEDAAALLSAIYEGRVAPPDQTQQMLSLLENTVYRDGWIPAALPDLPVAHKVGFYGSVLNDAALVLAPEHPFVLVVFTDSAYGVAPTIFQTVAAQTLAFVTAPTLP